MDDTYKYKSVDVAAGIINEANEKKVSINITKLQKLLYIVYGIYLIACKQRLTEEHPRAWPYGSVFPVARCEFLDKMYRPLSDSMSLVTDCCNDSDVRSIVDFVLDSFGKWTAGQLTEWSHQPGSPWEKTTRRKCFRWGEAIDDGDICDFFSKLVEVN